MSSWNSRRRLAVFPVATSLVAMSLVACGGKAAEGTNPGDCADQIDNDENGAVDCADPGCSGAPDCAETEADTDTDTDTDTDSDSDTDADTDSDADADTGSPVVIDPALCNSNTTTVEFEEGGRATLDGFVWTFDKDGVAIIGLQSASGDPCTESLALESVGGWLAHVYIATTPGDGDTFTMVYNAAAETEMDLRLENQGSGDAQFAVDDQGAMTVATFDATGVMQASDWSFTLDGGATAEAQSFSACWCPQLVLH